MVSYIFLLKNIVDAFYRKLPVLYLTIIPGCFTCTDEQREVNRFGLCLCQRNASPVCFVGKCFIIYEYVTFKYLKKDDCNNKQNW